MKKLCCIALSLVIIFSILPISADAENIKEEIVYFEDGSYIITVTENNGNRASGTVTGNKQSTHYGNDGVSNWKVVLTGTFTYTGSGSTCTASSVNITIYDSSWYTVSKSSGKSDNKATAYVVMGEKQGGVTVAKVPVSLTLSCDKNGNLS